MSRTRLDDALSSKIDRCPAAPAKANNPAKGSAGTHGPVRFEWNGQAFELAQMEDGEQGRIELRSLSKNLWTAELAQYDLTRKRLSGREHKAFRDEPEQRGHPTR